MQLVKQSGFQKIYAVESFEAEYKSLYKNAGDYETYHNKFLFNLQYLDDAQSLQVALAHKNFEPLSETDSLFCIRHVSNRNPRTIFFYALDENIYILLHTFFEKDTKKDYRRAIKKAKSILKELGIS